MSNYIYTFYVERDDEEIELQADCDVLPLVRGRYSGLPEDSFPDEGGFAEINDIYCDSFLWEGTLTAAERKQVEREAYEEFIENVDTPDPDYIVDDDYDLGIYERDFSVGEAGKAHA